MSPSSLVIAVNIEIGRIAMLVPRCAIPICFEVLPFLRIDCYMRNTCKKSEQQMVWFSVHMIRLE